MKKLFALFFLGVFSFLAGFLLINWIAYPVLNSYPHLSSAMARFAYTKEFLIGFVTLSMWLFFVQMIFQRFTVIYTYLFYSMYLFLLFIVLFAKARNYHSYSFELFDFVVRNKRVLLEAALNVIYFIPLGILFSFKSRFWEFCLISVLFICGVETIQYVFYVGTFAVSDIMLNLIGCLIGRLLQRFFPLLWHDTAKTLERI